MTMARPFLHSLRGRRKRIPAPLELNVPALSPQRVMHAMRVVVKPHDWTRDAIRHRLDTDGDAGAEQVWTPDSAPFLDDLARRACERLGMVPIPTAELGDAPAPGGLSELGIKLPPSLWRLKFAPETPLGHRRGLAEVCSRHLPATWFWLEPLAVRGGRFWRREKGFRLHLRVANDVHLPREVRAVLKGLLPRV